MIYIKCSKCSNVHNTFLSNSFSAVGKLQTAIECPTCRKTGKETLFTECCCKYVLSLLGIHSTQRDSEDLGLRHQKDNEGFCYAYENCTEESCRYYLPYQAAFTNGANWECQHHRLDGRCAV